MDTCDILLLRHMFKAMFGRTLLALTLAPDFFEEVLPNGLIKRVVFFKKEAGTVSKKPPKHNLNTCMLVHIY
jgi:hypothetical protein